MVHCGKVQGDMCGTCASARQGVGDLGNGVCNVSHWTRSFRDSAAATEQELSSSELY